MRKLLLMLFAILVLASCGPKNTLQVSGEISNLDSNLNLYVGEELFAQIEVKEGKFSYKGELNAPEMFNLRAGQKYIGTLFAEPGDRVTVSGDLNDLKKGILVTGNNLSEQVNKYNQEKQAIYDRFPEEKFRENMETILKESNELEDKYIEANRNNILVLYLLRYSLDHKNPQYLNELFNQLPANVASHPTAVRYKNRIEEILSTEPGQKYIDINLPDINGNEISVSSLLAQGKYVLIDFWSSGCVPCMKEMPHLCNAYAKYKEKGFEIYGVSNDFKKDQWQEAMNRANMSWVNVCSFKNWEEPAVKAYYLRQIPANFLVNPEGVIIGKNLRGEQVEAKLAEIFG